MSLPGCPAGVVRDGLPHTGRYAGLIPTIDWSGLKALPFRSTWWQWLHHKRWVYVGLAAPDWFIGLAIVDLGWGMSAFAYVFDRCERKLVLDGAWDGVPGWSGTVSDQPVVGGHAQFRGRGVKLSVQHQPDGRLAVRAQYDVWELDADLWLDDAPPFLLAVGPVAGGVAHATQKSPGLRVSGGFACAGQRHALDQAVGAVDCSNGLLPRETAWLWACAHGRRLGFNLQAGYFGTHENVLWLDGELIPLGAAQFAFDPAHPLAPWRIWTDDGLLDLHFRPEGARQDDRNLWVAASHYIQPVGTFHGRVRAAPNAPVVQVDGLLGVTEDHRSRW